MPRNTDYIDNVDYKDLESKIKDLKSTLEDLSTKQSASRKLRYAEIDVEAEREQGRLQPDEMFVPQHIIDTNIRREQSSYVQYITQSQRAVITANKDNPTDDTSILDKDLTYRLRYDGWQLPHFSNIDAFEANGYSIMEIDLDLNNPGEVKHEVIAYGDFAFVSDTRDLQAVEMTARAYYFTKTQLKRKIGDVLTNPEAWDNTQVQRILDSEPESNVSASVDQKDKSLHKVLKVMFRINGVVNVAWCAPELCDGWLRLPKPLFIGRKKFVAQQPSMQEMMVSKLSGIVPQPQQIPVDDFETEFPYVLFPYLISENDTISDLKGRVFLDQDLQEAVTSLLSSTCTQARRAAGLYFSKDVQDPNDEFLLQKNIFFKSGCIINGKVNSFQLPAPEPGMFSAIQMLMVSNQNETSQMSAAVMNRKDSRKTATEVASANQQQQVLSIVQVVLYSIALTQLYRKMSSIIKSRVLTGLIKVSPDIAAQYQKNFTVKPAGDTDVIEKQELIQKMQNAWPVVQNTPAAQLFLSDLLELMFPGKAERYVQVLQQAQQAQQSAQAQQQQQLMGVAKQMADGIINLSKNPEMFSDMGKLHALPIVAGAAQQLETMMKQMGAK